MRDVMAEVRKIKRFKWYSFKSKIKLRLAIFIYKHFPLCIMSKILTRKFFKREVWKLFID
jgi:hypothetical protein